MATEPQRRRGQGIAFPEVLPANIEAQLKSEGLWTDQARDLCKFKRAATRNTVELPLYRFFHLPDGEELAVRWYHCRKANQTHKPVGPMLAVGGPLTHPKVIAWPRKGKVGLFQIWEHEHGHLVRPGDMVARTPGLSFGEWLLQADHQQIVDDLRAGVSSS
jgi:hypothetical protein